MLDQVLTITVSRHTIKGNLLPDSWNRFKDDTADAILRNGGRVVFCGSDQTNSEQAYIVDVTYCSVERIRHDIAEVLQHYSQDNGVFSVDLMHEPVASTSSGYVHELKGVLA